MAYTVFMQPPSDQIIGVKVFLDILNETMNFAFPAVTVEGEVSGFKVNQSKWVFFDLKDDDATLPCFMPVFQLKVPLEDGMKIRVTGVPKITNWGKFSFTVRQVSLAGEGELKRAFELLRSKLEREGLFEDARKRSLPDYPQTIGLVTSGTSAAYADFIKIINGRWGGLHILLADVQVQGLSAPEQIVSAISYFNQLPEPPDVLVVIRGGGSLEDLQAFNTEMVARAVAASRTPTVVGVGHEVDVSLADFAADRRAATPTNAAQIVVPERIEVQRQIDHRRQRMLSCLEQTLTNRHHQLRQAVHGLERFIRVPQARLASSEAALLNSQRGLLRFHQQRLESLGRLLGSFDPTANLKRGYAIVRHNQQVLTDASRVKTGDELVVQLAKGGLKSQVRSITETSRAKT
jgi:exodeoxyribonuclease VII large subunit